MQKRSKLKQLIDEYITLSINLTSLTTPIFHREKSGLTMCVKTALDNSLALPDAQCNQAQKGSLSALYKGIFKNLDSKCRDRKFCHPEFFNSLFLVFLQNVFKSVWDFLIDHIYFLFNCDLFKIHREELKWKENTYMYRKKVLTERRTTCLLKKELFEVI